MREYDTIRSISKTLNSNSAYNRTLAGFSKSDDVDTNSVIAALDKSNGLLYRARILSIDCVDLDDTSDSKLYTVFFIDYGHTAQCELSGLRCILSHELQNLPPRCFECRLAEVQPAIIQSETNDWSPDANHLFHERIKEADYHVTAEVCHARIYPFDLLGQALCHGHFNVSLFGARSDRLCVSFVPMANNDSRDTAHRIDANEANSFITCKRS